MAHVSRLKAYKEEGDSQESGEADKEIIDLDKEESLPQSPHENTTEKNRIPEQSGTSRRKQTLVPRNYAALAIVFLLMLGQPTL